MRFALTALALTFTVGASAKDFRIAGSYGFDWLKTDSAKCRVISAAQAATFKKCQFFKNGNAFGLSSTYHRCVGPMRSEYFIYESKAKCVDALETMNANGP
jgi:hypothetical protein